MKEILKTIGGFLFGLALFAFFGGFYVGAKYSDNSIGLNSLQEENLSLEVELNRWEKTIEWYRRNNPKEAKKLEKWRSHNTE